MGTQEEVRLPMADGVGARRDALPAGPARGPQPCLLEALPYRKDDLTSSYAETYERMRDEFSFAVCRVDVRGTGSSQGDATDEYPEAEQSDLAEVIAWLAEQEWCNGSVGMFGTSYSGFNSLQMAVERPPALKAICAIYATDDRWTDDVHWRGGALRLVDLVDYDHYMTPMVMLPPVPAVWGDGAGATSGCGGIETSEPWVLTWLRENRHGPYWDHGSVRARRHDAGLRAHRVRGADHRRVGRRLPQQQLPDRRGARRCRGPAPAARRAVGARRPRERDARAADRPRRRDGGVVRPLAARARMRRDTGTASTCSCAPRPGRSRTSTCTRGTGSASPGPRPPRRGRRLPITGERELVVEPDVGTAAWIDCAGHLPWGLSTDQRLDDARSLTWEWPTETPSATRRSSASRARGCG